MSKRTLLRCPETRKRTSEFLNKNWFKMNEIKHGLQMQAHISTKLKRNRFYYDARTVNNVRSHEEGATTVTTRD